MTDATALDRMSEKFVVNDESGCWEWTASKTAKNGYGQIWFRGKWAVAHRLAYELTVEPVPAGLQIDHLCRNRVCINPDHLEPVTPRENMARGMAWEAARSALAVRPKPTHCPQGHAYEGANLYVTKRGFYVCRLCRNAAKRRHVDRKRGAHGQQPPL